MGIEKHDFPLPAPVEAGASLARLLDGLTRTLLDLPDVEPVAEPEATTVIPEPRAERRHGSVLNELGFLDD